jgi:hypothetical protein
MFNECCSVSFLCYPIDAIMFFFIKEAFIMTCFVLYACLPFNYHCLENLTAVLTMQVKRNLEGTNKFK